MRTLLFFQQWLATVMALYAFLTQFKIAKPYPAAGTEAQELLHGGQWLRSKDATHHDAIYEADNSSNVLPSQFEHAHIRRARQVSSGCVKSKFLQPCGNVSILTVECRQRSKTCISFRNNARCVAEKSFFPACGKVFNTNCFCRGQSAG